MTKVLIVDDSQTVLSFLQAVLENAQFEVVTAVDGADALTKVHETRPDLIVTDAVMPGMGGFELVQALRNDPATESLPVIILTSSGDPQDFENPAGRPQPDAFVKKSADFGPLLAEIRECVERRG